MDSLEDKLTLHGFHQLLRRFFELFACFEVSQQLLPLLVELDIDRCICLSDLNEGLKRSIFVKMMKENLTACFVLCMAVEALASRLDMLTVVVEDERDVKFNENREFSLTQLQL